MGLFRRIAADAIELARSMRRKGSDTIADVATPPMKEAVKVALSQDGYKVLLTTRLRESARKWHVPGVNHMGMVTDPSALEADVIAIR